MNQPILPLAGDDRFNALPGETLHDYMNRARRIRGGDLSALHRVKNLREELREREMYRQIRGNTAYEKMYHTKPAVDDSNGDHME